MSMRLNRWMRRALWIGAFLSLPVAAQPDDSLPWQPIPLPNLDGLRQRGGIDAGLLRLSAGPLSEKQTALPGRYDLRARHYTVMGGTLIGTYSRVLFTTGTAQYRPLGEGFMLQHLRYESEDGSIRGEGELVSWLGVIPVAQNIAVHENGIVSIAAVSATHFSGAPPDPARILPGSTFSFGVELKSNATRHLGKSKTEQQESIAKRTYACTVGQPLEAQRLEDSFRGRALPISCQVNESGTASEKTYYYLEHYAVAIPGWLGGTREAMEGESLVWFGRRGTFRFNYTWQAGLRALPAP